MRKLVLLLVVVALVLALPTAVLAGQPPKGLKGLQGQAGNSNVAFVELWEKDPDTWEIVDEDAAWGKLKYNLEGPEFDFVFNGHGLELETEYSLIYYADPWPGTGGAEIASGSSNDEGDIHLGGSTDIGSLPVDEDENDGAKIWLVLSADYDADAGEMTGWDPEEYLFEYDLITYTDTDV